ncbi:nascent polypeptide-associated complex subunit alpha, muscle-specific form-like [Corvus moneduloides]|uniref:nascent polypeptide-associated complex subunit alpha, muscle-specific form-like n=1 Tax=Corvus moneduloides TaxID=1196302 RepID=UPI0013627DB6|nr:nascent polypeptide-associated complex subunit alpha, muscle-specific form-like [Corvus moneduloides]
MLGLSFAGAAQPGPQHSPVPVTEGDWDEVTLHFQSPGADPTSGRASDSMSHTGRAANRTALLPGAVPGKLGRAEALHTAAVKPQDGHTSPGQLRHGSTQGSQATTALALQREPESSPGAGLSPPSSSSGLPQPFPSGGTNQGSPQVTALSSPPVIKQREVPSPTTSLLTPTLDFHPPRREMAASPFPPRAGISLGRAGEGWLPTGTPPSGKRPKDTNPPAQPDPTAGLTPAHPRKTQSLGAGVTTSAIPPQPAPGDLGSVYSTTTQARPAQASPLLSLQQATTGNKGRNSTSAVTNGSGHPAQLPAPHTLPPGRVNSSSFLMEAPAAEEFLPSPFQVGTTDGQQPLSLHRALSCTKHVPPETNRSSQETAALALQRDAAPWAVTGRPGKSPSPERPQPSLSSSSSSQLWISTLKPSTTAKELKEATSPLSPGMPTFGNADLQPWDSVPAGLQPPGAFAPPRAGMQPMGLPSPAGRDLHTPTTSSTAPGSGSRLQGASAPPVPQGASAGMLQVSTEHDSRRRSKTGSPPLSPAASPVPSPSGAHGHRDQAVPPPSPTKPGAPAPILLSSRAQGSHPSSTTAHPGPGVPSEVPAPLAQALVHQFRMSLDAAARNLGTVRGDPLTLLPSSPLLSFVLKSTDGMICLQPMQDSPLPTEFPNASVEGLVSIQQILAASNSSALDLANLQHLSPSSLVLVRPVFVLLPSDRAHSQVLPSPQSDHRVAHLATNVGTTGSSQDIPVKTSSSYPSGKSVGPETALSTVSKQEAERAKVTSEPVPVDPNPTALRGLSPAVTSAPGHVLDPRTSPTAQTMPRLPEEMQIPAPHPQQATGIALLPLSAEPGTSPLPPELVSTQSPQSSPKVVFTTGRPQSSSAAPFLPAKGLRGSPEPASSTRAAGQGQHGQGGSVPTPSSAHAPCTGCLTPSSPPRVFPSTKTLQSRPQRLPGTKLLPSPVVPSTSSASSVLPAGNEHSDSREGSSTARSGVPVPATAPQTPITAGKPGLTQRLELELTSTVPQPFITTQRPTLAPEQTLLSTEVQRKTPVSGRVLAVVSHAGMSASSSAPSPAPAGLFSQTSTGQSTRPAETSTSAGERGAGKSLGTSMSPSAVFNTRTPQPPSAAPGNNSSLALTPAQPSVSTGSVTALQGHPKPTQGTAQAAAAAAAETPLPAAEGDGVAASLEGKERLHLPTPALQPAPDGVLSSSGVLSAALGKGEEAARGEAVPSRQLPTQAPVSAAHPASPRLPLEEVSPPLEELSPPLEELSHPLEELSHPLEEVSHPLEELSHPLEVLSPPLEEVSPPLEEVSPPLEELSPPLEEVSPPLEEVSHPLEEVSPPLEEVSPPLEELSPPLEEVSPPLEEVSHPLEEVSHPLEELSHPLEEVSHPLEELSHPLEELSHPLEEVSHPLEEVSPPLEEVSPPLEEVSHPLEELSPPLEEVSPPLEELSPPLEELSPPLEEVSPPLEELSPPLEELSPPLEEVSHPLEEVSPPLEDAAMEQDSAHSSPGTAAGPPTPRAVSVPANRLVNQGTHQPAVNDPELLPARDLIQVPPAPESPSNSPGNLAALTLPGDPCGDTGAWSAGERLTPEEGAALGCHRAGWASTPGSLLWVLLLQPGWVSFYSLFLLFPPFPFFPSLAIVSDSCGSRNHSVQLSLSPAGATAPEIPGSEPSQDTFLALVALQSNSSQALLQIHSCCVTPSASPGAAGAQCCLFHRLPWECRHVQLLQGSGSRAASFSIQLFQMLNHSVAYLHCELRVCLPGQPGCEQDCLESVEPLPQPSDRTSYGNLHNLVSLGPVWKMNNRFLYKPVEGAGPAMLLPTLLGSLTGFAVLGSAFMGLWLHHRQKAKPSRYPPFGEFHGL